MNDSYTQTISSNEKWFKIGFKELIQFKELFLMLAYRDFKVRYSQTVLGFLWALLQPLATLLIFTLIFGKALKLDTQGIPYPVFAMVGMTVWTYFSFVLTQSGNSIIASQGMIQKIYFPRLIIPLSKAIVGMIDFVITAILLFLLMLYYQISPTINLWLMPLFFVHLLFVSLGMGIWFSALSIRYRDIQHIIPFIVQIGLYITPVAYGSTLIPEKYLFLYNINPLAGLIQAFRWSVLGTGTLGLNYYFSLLISIIIFITGIYYFNKTSRVIADIV